MRDSGETRESLQRELTLARKRIAELEASEVEIKKELRGLQKSDKIYRSLAEDAFFSSKVGIFVLDPNFKIAWVSHSIGKYFGLSPKEILGKDKRKLIKEQIKDIFEDPEAFASKVLHTYDNNTYVENFECHVLPGPGREERWLEHWSEPIEKGVFAGGRIETYVDITERKRIERRMGYLNKILRAIWRVNQLVTRERHMGLLIKKACKLLMETGAYNNVWIALFDQGGRFYSASEAGVGAEFNAMVELLKRGGPKGCREEMLTKSGVQIITNSSLECKGCPLAKIYKDKGAMRVRLEYRGRTYGLIAASAPREFLHDADAKTLLEEVGGDIAFAVHSIELEEKRKAAEKARQATEARYRLLYEIAGEPIFTYDKNLILTDVNRVACEKIGIEKDKLIGRNILELGLLHPDDTQKAMDHIKKLLEGASIETEKLRFKRKDGSYLIAEVTATPIIEQGKLVAITNVCHDVTERESLTAALKKSEEKFRLLSENAPDIVFSLGKDGLITYVNSSTRQTLGFEPEELIGLYPTELCEERDRKFLIRLFKRVSEGKETLHNVGVTLLDKKGKERYFLLSCSPVERAESEDLAAVGMLKDTTEQRDLEAQLRHAQKMEAIGTLAGGIAHDFNNILSAIMGYAELALIDIPHDSPIKDNLQQVLNASSRARDLVRQILTFSRRGEQRRVPISIVPIIKEGLKLLRASLPSFIEIRQKIEPDPGIVEADPTQIHQVLMNLCTNAGQAMMEKGGLLEVTLEKVKIDNELSATNPDLRLGPYVRLTVRDTGHGMERDIMERIFDPYFTTKREGEGTGLGLAVVHGIVKNHGGAIKVKSTPGKGTTFEVYFPVVDVPMKSAQATDQLMPKGHEYILFIDDEQPIAELGRLMLEKLGYKVVTKTSSVEALELFKADPTRFDLVITDMTMPNMTGDMLATKLLKIRPDIPIILCTGFSTRITEQRAKEMGIQRLVMKPLSMKQLAEVVRGVLDEQKKSKLRVFL